MRIPWFTKKVAPQPSPKLSWLEKHYDIYPLKLDNPLVLSHPVIDNHHQIIFRIGNKIDNLPKVMNRSGKILSVLGGHQIYHRTSPENTESHFAYSVQDDHHPDVFLVIKGMTPQTVTLKYSPTYSSYDPILMLIPRQPASDWVKE